MLQGAAAADAEMRTNRRDAFGAGLFDVEQMAPIGMARHGFGFDGFARQRAGHVNRALAAIGHAVAAMAEPIDDKMLNHAQPR